MKKIANVFALLMCAVLAFTLWSCDSPVASNDSGNSSKESGDKGTKEDGSASSYHVTYVDGVDNETITVPTDSKAYKTGDTVNVKFSGIGNRTGYAFTGWKNGTKTYTSNGTKSFQIETSDVILTAQWAQNAPPPVSTYTITIAEGIEHGNVKADKSTAEEGEVVTLTALPADGYQFANWAVKDADNAVITVSEGGTFTMPAKAVIVSVNFTLLPPATYSISVTGGVAKVNGQTVTSAEAGTEITVTANSPDTGKEFDVWLGNHDFINESNEHQATINFTMPAENVSLEASFEFIDYTITVDVGIAHGRISAPSVAHYGDTVTINGTGETVGYYLESVTVRNGNDSIDVYGTGDQRTFTMPAGNVNINARFAAETYSIRVNSTENGNIEVDSSALYDETVTIRIKPDSGCILDSISATCLYYGSAINLPLNGDGNTRTFRMPAGIVTITANFVRTEAPTKNSPTAIGDIVLSNGKFISLSYADFMTAEQKQSAVAVIFDVSEKKGVGLKEGESLSWASRDTSGFTTKFNTSENDGFTNWARIKKIDSEGTLDAATNYSAFNWVNSYSAYGFTSGWYLPAKEELETLFAEQTLSAVESAITKIGISENVVALTPGIISVTDIIGASYGLWSSSQVATEDDKAYNYAIRNSISSTHSANKAFKARARAIRIFDNFTVNISGGTVSKTSAAASELITVRANVPDNKVFVKWTANPEVVFINENASTTQFAMPAGNVTITPVFKDAPIGTKARPTEVGDIVFNDGTALPASVYNTRELSNREKQNAISVVAYVYMVNGEPDDCITVGLKQEYIELCTSASQGNTNTEAFSNIVNGHDNKSAGDVRDFICNGRGNITDYSEDLYPALYFAQHYTGYNNLGNITNDWLIPNLTDFLLMYDGKDAVINAISKIGSNYAMPFINNDNSWYFTVTQYAGASDKVYLFNLNDKSYGANYKGGKSPVLVIRYFMCHDY